MASTALAITGALSAAGSIGGGLFGASQASKAASQQVAAEQSGIDLQKQEFDTQTANQAPYLTAGTKSLDDLTSAISDGTFGPGSLKAAPTAPGGYTLPTQADAAATPGYQFTKDEGDKSVLEGASAAGGSITGGTLKALDTFGSGLADSTYNDTVNRTLQAYGANLQGYQSQLAGYNTQQAAQQQAFNQLYAPTSLGESAVSSINNSGAQSANAISNILNQQGQSAASGTVASSNAITNGLSGGLNTLNQTALLGKLLPSLAGKATPNVNLNDAKSLGIAS